MPTVLLAYYCALILVASIVGGMIPVWFQLTHRWMQFAVSFVAGVMLGIGVLHMLPHAIMDATSAATLASDPSNDSDPVLGTLSRMGDTVWWISISLLAGMFAMFFIERFFSYHHHDVPGWRRRPTHARPCHMNTATTMLIRTVNTICRGAVPHSALRCIAY